MDRHTIINRLVSQSCHHHVSVDERFRDWRWGGEMCSFRTESILVRNVRSTNPFPRWSSERIRPGFNHLWTLQTSRCGWNDLCLLLLLNSIPSHEGDGVGFTRLDFLVQTNDGHVRGRSRLLLGAGWKVGLLRRRDCSRGLSSRSSSWKYPGGNTGRDGPSRGSSTGECRGRQ